MLRLRQKSSISAALWISAQVSRHASLPPTMLRLRTYLLEQVISFHSAEKTAITQESRWFLAKRFFAKHCNIFRNPRLRLQTNSCLQLFLISKCNENFYFFFANGFFFMLKFDELMVLFAWLVFSENRWTCKQIYVCEPQSPAYLVNYKARTKTDLALHSMENKKNC